MAGKGMDDLKKTVSDFLTVYFKVIPSLTVYCRRTFVSL